MITNGRSSQLRRVGPIPLITAQHAKIMLDWHPIDHVSFAATHPGKEAGDSINITFLDTSSKIETQGLYANHCIPETWGAEIESGIQTRLHYLEGFRTPVNYIKKAQNHSVDSYSAFADNQYHQFTTLDSELSLHSIETIVITGLITNACVRGTSIDGIKLGYEVVLIEDATETISAEIKASAIAELETWGRCPHVFATKSDSERYN